MIEPSKQRSHGLVGSSLTEWRWRLDLPSIARSSPLTGQTSEAPNSLHAAMIRPGIGRDGIQTATAPAGRSPPRKLSTSKQSHWDRLHPRPPESGAARVQVFSR
jgi:hypothetical protein